MYRLFKLENALEKEFLNGVIPIFILFLDKPSVRPTFLSGKVGKTIVIRKTRQLPASIKNIAETLYN